MFFLLGLLAHDIDKYGVKNTCKLIIADIIVILILMAIGHAEIAKNEEQWHEETESSIEVYYENHPDAYRYDY